MQKLHQHISTKKTPQSQPIPGKKQVQNYAGGFVYEVDKWSQFLRFLIIGTEGGFYYAGEKELTARAVPSVLKCIEEDGIRAVDLIVEVSDSGRAKKNDMALLCLAIAASSSNKDTRLYALRRMHKVVRTATHLFMFVEYAEAFRGWGRAFKYTIQNWYQFKKPENLAYQMVKYKQRGGWSHADLLRLTKPTPADEAHDWLYGYATGKIQYIDDQFWAMKKKDGKLIAGSPIPHCPLPLVEAHEEALRADNKRQVIKLIHDHGLTHEMIPNEFKNEPEVWEALLETMPISALIWNLGKMTSVGLLKPMSQATKKVCESLGSATKLIRGRVHPITILSAHRIYERGHGEKGNLKWEPVGSIVDALDAAFYLSYGSVQPSNKRQVLALDVSGSMYWTEVMGMSHLNSMEVSCAMSLVTANVESDYVIMGFSEQFRELPISPRQRLSDAMAQLKKLKFSRTDCALPMIWAMQKGVNADMFTVYTDNETWAGSMHPSQALIEYRQKHVPDAKLCVVATAATNFSIADPNDRGMFDIAGFSSDVPQLIAAFARGEL